MTVTVPTSTVSLILDPTSSPFATQDINITVGTNNKSGYWMTMTSSTGSSDLVNTDDSTKTIPTLTTAGDYDSSSFEVNKWGYKVNNGSYNPFVSGNIIHQSNTTANGELVKLTLGSKIDYLQSPGTYNIALTIKALPIMTTNYIQNLDPTLCTEDPMVVVDSRDEQVYTIQRLKDGKCWMMDNLNLGASALSVSQLDSTNTNITNGSNISASDWSSYASGPSASYTASYRVITSETSVTGSDTDPTSKTKYGTVYNYCVASAGTICTDSNSNNATSDICPAGWRLPTGSTGGEFEALANNSAYNTNAKMRAPIKDGGAAFALAGAIGSRQGENGYYWSSVRENNTRMYYLSIDNTDVRSTGSNDRLYGFAVRCVLKDTMQEFSSIDAANMSVGDTKTLTDSRDGQKYTVAKLADNKIWMLENLRLDPTAVDLATLKGKTNATDQALTYLKNGGGSSPYTNYGVSDAWTSSYADYYNRPLIKASGTGNLGDWTKESIIPASGFAPAGKAGVYYNYCAASAGTYCYPSGSGTGNASQDICPSGWRLPTGGSGGECQALYAAYSSNAENLQSNLRTTYTGWFVAGTATQGSAFTFWTSTRYDGRSMYQLTGTSSSTDPLNYSGNGRPDGRSIRCIKN